VKDRGALRCASPNTVHLTGISVSLGGAGFSLQRTSVRLPRVSRNSGERAEARCRLKRNLQKYRAGPLPCSPTRECGRGSVSAMPLLGAFRAGRASKRFLRILQVPLKSAPQYKVNATGPSPHLLSGFVGRRARSGIVFGSRTGILGPYVEHGDQTRRRRHGPIGVPFGSRGRKPMRNAG
jgi:hypothetical protein